MATHLLVIERGTKALPVVSADPGVVRVSEFQFSSLAERIRGEAELRHAQ